MTTGPEADGMRRERDQRRTLNLTTLIILGMIVLKGITLLQLKHNLDSPLLPSYLWNELARPTLIELALLSTGLLTGLLLRWKGRYGPALAFHIGAIVLAGLRSLL